MNNWFKVLTTAFVISIFAVQAVLACACELDMPKNDGHDHHQMMAHDMAEMSDKNTCTDHECSGNCHVSFNETDDTDFLILAPEKPKQEKVKYTVSHHLLINDFSNFDHGPPSWKIIRSSVNPFINTSLFAQGILLRI